MRRREAREKTLQALYQMDVARHSLEQAMANVLEETDAGEDTAFFQQLVSGVVRYMEQLDTQLVPHLQNWSLERLAVVERNVLRLGAYELIFEKEIPVNVSLNEAVELAKLYSSDESGRFVNGVLSSLSASLAAAGEE